MLYATRKSPAEMPGFCIASDVIVSRMSRGTGLECPSSGGRVEDAAGFWVVRGKAKFMSLRPGLHSGLRQSGTHLSRDGTAAKMGHPSTRRVTHSGSRLDIRMAKDGIDGSLGAGGTSEGGLAVARCPPLRIEMWGTRFSLFPYLCLQSRESRAARWWLSARRRARISGVGRGWGQP